MNTNGKDVILVSDKSGNRKNLDSAIMEKNTNANKPRKKSTEGNDGLSEEKKNLESRTYSKTNVVDQKESGEKESDDELKILANRKVESKLFNDEVIVHKSTSRDIQGSETGSLSLSSSKDYKISEEGIKVESVAKEGKRKRRISSVQERDSSVEKSERVNKRKRSKSNEDKFCWRCHKESVDSHCTACPRAWHRRCMGGGPTTSPQNWICGECATILKAENAETRSLSMAQMSVEQLCILLKHIVGRMRDYPGSEPFWKAVDLEEVPNYLDYVVKPMDLSLLESNVRAKLYGSTEAFMADAKWIQHNCIVFNTCGGVYADTSKLTNAARQIIKAARQEVSEIEACPDCYGHARNLPRPQPSWFIEPCRRPHPLVWAKLKGFPFWPAKAMSRVNGQGHVDVRFFGAHDRAWVPPRDLYLYSEDPPTPQPRKRNLDMDECVKEITRHCRKLESAFGQFKFAPPKIQYNPKDPTQITLMLPNYDPLQLNNYLPPPNVSSQKKPPIRKRALNSKKKSSIGESTMNNTSDSANDSTTLRGDSDSDCEKHIEASRIPKGSSLPSNNFNQYKSSASSKSNDIQNVFQNSPDKENSLKEKKLITKRRRNIVSKNNEKLMDHNMSTDDEIRTEEENQTIDKSSDGQSSSENEVSLEIRQSLKSDAVSHKTKDVSVENTVKSQNALSNDSESAADLKLKVKNGPKTNRNQVRVYKPKTRMVNQVNAERAKATAGNQQKDIIECMDDSNAHKDQTAISLLSSDDSFTTEISMTSGHFLCSPNNTVNTMINSIGNKNLVSPSVATALSTISTLGNPESIAGSPTASILLITNSPSESDKKVRSIEDCVIINDVPAIIKQEPKEQHTPTKKESKARKSFINKPPMFPQITPPSPPMAPASSPDAMVYIPGHRTENQSDYLLLPPEAGPLSAQLHRGGQELARRMTQLMEEALSEAAQVKSYHPDNSDINQRAIVHHLRLQIERMRWQHQQHLAELKHNTDLTLREMKASLEAERYRAIEETKREAEEERLRSVEETKRKQWCALCGNEALFYCCWNTAYCDYPCQQAHWSTHMRTCAQNPPPNTIITTNSNANQQQVMPRLVITSPHASSNVWGA